MRRVVLSIALLSVLLTGGCELAEFQQAGWMAERAAQEWRDQRCGEASLEVMAASARLEMAEAPQSVKFMEREIGGDGGVMARKLGEFVAGATVSQQSRDALTRAILGGDVSTKIPEVGDVLDAVGVQARQALLQEREAVRKYCGVKARASVCFAAQLTAKAAAEFPRILQKHIRRTAEVACETKAGLMEADK